MIEKPITIMNAFRIFFANNSDSIKVPGPKGNLNAEGILKEMGDCTEFGKNFLNSIDKMVYDSIMAMPTNRAIMPGNYTPGQIIEEMERGTPFGSHFLESALKIIFLILQKSYPG